MDEEKIEQPKPENTSLEQSNGGNTVMLESQLIDELNATNKPRLQKARELAHQVIEFGSSNPKKMVELTLKSPDLVVDCIVKESGSEKTLVVLEHLRSESQNEQDFLSEMMTKLHKNHEPLPMRDYRMILAWLDEEIGKLQGLRETTEPNERWAILDSVSGMIKMGRDNLKEMRAQRIVYEQIEHQIKEHTSYFHVSSIESDKVADGSDFMLIPGVANAWDEGVYASQRPILFYLGGEASKKEMQSCVIFNIPVDEEFIFNRSQETTGLMNVNTNKRAVRFEGIVKKRLERQDLERMGALDLDKLPNDIPVFLVTATKITFDPNYQEEREKVFKS
ncbi:MAG: hypothetical protein WAP74_01045 [Patescibacteria group bacterium]